MPKCWQNTGVLQGRWRDDDEDDPEMVLDYHAYQARKFCNTWNYLYSATTVPSRIPVSPPLPLPLGFIVRR